MNTHKTINELKELVLENTSFAQELLNLDEELLNTKRSNESWSALECIEHINRYADFYVPEVTRVLSRGETKTVVSFKPGLLGNHFAKSMKVKPKLNKMKTFKSMNPVGSNLDKSAIQKYLKYQKDWLRLLDESMKYDLGRLKTNITISKWIKLKLGDTLRVVIYHEERHIAQAKRAVKTPHLVV